MDATATRAEGQPASIVVIEDEQDIVDVLAYNLVRAGYEVHAAVDGPAGLELVRSTLPSLVILDLMLPGLDGVSLCRRMRDDATTHAIPVIMLTARDDEADVVAGLGAGADDYVTKPFRTSELLARVQAVLRRGAPHADAGAPRLERATTSSESGERIELPGLVVDTARHEVLVHGQRVSFTRTELRLLHVLASAAGRVLGRDTLIERVMGEDAWITDRTIDVHVRAIRKKLGGGAGMLETVRGVGYRLKDDE